MNIHPTPIDNCLLLEPKVLEDDRGIFFEAYNQEILDTYLGKQVTFVQDNHSVSRVGVLRGLHFQREPHAQAKLVRVIHGAVQDVVVDLRPGSKTFGRHFSIMLSAANRRMLFIPRGLAHGFLALMEDTEFLYKCDNFYNRASEDGIIYNDPELNIEWALPTGQIILSEKDRALPGFKKRAQ